MTATNPLILVAGLILGLAALAISLFLIPRSRNSEIALSRRRPNGGNEGSVLTRVTNSAVALVDNSVSASRASGTRILLEQAGLRMRPADYVLLVICGTFTGALIGFVLGGLIGIVLFAVGVPLGARLFLKVRTSRRRAQFEAQLGDTLQMLSGSMRAGHSLLRAVDAVAQEAQSPTRDEFARIVGETRLGRDLRDALMDAAARLHSEDFLWAAQAIEIHREVGGDLAEVLDHVGETIRERSQIKGQVRALSAEGRLSAYILIALPTGMFFYLCLFNGTYIRPLFTNPIGWVMLVVAVILLGVGTFWLSRVVKIKF
ncbi:type II secretion system F family protein [Paenarthrobacter sp. JL.01a]|uniref:type II secretion system F family protein n=1 Tax=Paenarthrobacter sp. JL.01a TaxID=2979324 RepID=UPI0021C679AB|nr:type II secretion system F family protein [Paenarthrobacter sp. JL.01a]UXM90540.1 type II secretion system F family protein [Paenarthrobacter sp. JL.01a]